MSSSTTKVCFNSNCKEASDKWRRGWRRRTGEYAHLCDRCASAYEDGNFCETFHLNSSGWRCCESCGKQIHCGCIVSFHMFVLLDAGGIECLSCAKKSYILTPNPAWPPPSHFLPSQPERMKDLSVKTWSAIAGSGPVPWRQAPSLFSRPDTQSNVQSRMPFEIDVSGGIDRHHICERLSNASPEMKQERSYERFVNGKLRLGPSETLQNGNAGLDMKEQPYPFVNDFKPVFLKNDSSTSNLSARASSSKITDDAQLSAIISQPSAVSSPVGRQVSHIVVDSSGESQIRNGKARGDGRGRNQLLPRYRPQITNEELQQISSDSKSVITPLFEKMLSASDAGRIGRLVLPKKCAEAYFPPISQPEGLPLKVQDVKGKEWVFQFRFWPNNNSRMYVLEGITPCIQSMQLQAGDVVTFSRLEPEGKLVMGGRKASAIPSSDQGDEVTLIGTDASNPGDGSARHKSGDVISVNSQRKEKILEDKPVIHSKRKSSNFGVKNKRLRIDNEDVIELKLTWKEAQGLMRPPAKIVPSFFVVEGCEFEEFEEAAPVIGRPTILGIDHFGEKIQWVQCEDCFKWRKVPADALLPSRWICSENVWDLDRSLCSADEELTKEQLEHLLPAMNKDASRKEDITDQDADLFVALEGLDALANLAIQGEGEGLPISSESRTKHPRHKPGCTCIVCLQPPSGKGSKHSQSCDCVVCSSLKRRFRTLMERREKKQLEKEGDSSSQSLQWQQSPEKLQSVDTHAGTDAGISGLNQEEMGKWGYLDEANGRKSSTSPLKGQIDLNIQPDREEELSPSSDSGAMKHVLPGSADRFFRQQRSLGSDVIADLVGKQMQQDGIGGANFISCMALDSSHQKTV
ncbi:B3 domain-containing protein Os07g0563300 [Sesamum indicum]|uniref:B3 domain-containing protein Os07g0563300 n=1 Tax=Sesamum indicum TaxID=4182 RepID=A0A6I9UE39_SESIN|nr:B3 domain-containing protein Os07g0563300 [Sesamum indicum]